MTLGEKITMVRKKVALSQLELAEQVNVSRDTIGKYERNDIVPSVEVAKNIASVCKVSLDFLVSSQAQEEKNTIDNDMLKRVNEIYKLSDIDRDKIISIVDAFVRDSKAKQAYA